MCVRSTACEIHGQVHSEHAVQVAGRAVWKVGGRESVVLRLGCATVHFQDRFGQLTPVGFEPTPLRTGALSQRLRPLGQSVMGCRGALTCS